MKNISSYLFRVICTILIVFVAAFFIIGPFIMLSAGEFSVEVIVVVAALCFVTALIGVVSAEVWSLFQEDV